MIPLNLNDGKAKYIFNSLVLIKGFDEGLWNTLEKGITIEVDGVGMIKV